LVSQFKLKESGVARLTLPAPENATRKAPALPERLHYPLSS
jgi:hypothetical protein